MKMLFLCVLCASVVRLFQVLRNEPRRSVREASRRDRTRRKKGGKKEDLFFLARLCQNIHKSLCIIIMIGEILRRVNIGEQERYIDKKGRFIY
ncbi:MAG: hypothetical protein RLZZ507_2469 [Cyanobacteriota bacterium]|jgi:hypothetical protein